MLRSITRFAVVLNARQPILAVMSDLARAQFAIKSAGNLSVSVAVKTENREVRGIVIGRILVYVMQLDWPATRATDAAGPIRFEDDLIRDFLWHLSSHTR